MDETVLSVEKLAYILVAALVIVAITGYLIGEEKKAKWFRKRQKYSLFTRRGFLGEVFHFGYPCTKEGAFVTLGMAAAIIAVSWLIFVFG